MPHFFATANDLLPIFASVESKRPLRYTRSEHVTESMVRSFESGAHLPTLRAPSKYSSASTSPAYLVMAADNEVVLRELAPSEGRVRWSIDQLANPDSTMLWHGGMYGKSILLYGRVATTSKTRVALSLQRAFESAIKKQFVRVKAFYVGAQAEELLDRGFRLTISAESPNDYDLKR